MEKHRAIPLGYMTVGEAAKKVGTTVFTLQYYDNKNILKPSGKSEGGRRLYSNKDIVKLHQIQSMKYLGFSLEDIKTRLPSINTIEEVANVLSEQAKSIREKINSLTDVLEATEKLEAEVLQMKTVDWAKYADILALLQAKHDFYWAMKHFDDKLLDHAHSFDKAEQVAIINSQKQIFEKAAIFLQEGESPDSEKSQALAKDYWDVILEFTRGDASLLPELIEISKKQKDSEYKTEQLFVNKALGTYLANLGIDPFAFKDESI